MVTNKLFNMGITKVVKLDLHFVKMVLFALSSLQPLKPISGFSFPRQSEENQVNMWIKQKRNELCQTTNSRHSPNRLRLQRRSISLTRNQVRSTFENILLELRKSYVVIFCASASWYHVCIVMNNIPGESFGDGESQKCINKRWFASRNMLETIYQKSIYWWLTFRTLTRVFCESWIAKGPGHSAHWGLNERKTASTPPSLD